MRFFSSKPSAPADPRPLSLVLQERGYVYQYSSETLQEITDGPKRTLYLGIDPSADSLHVGNLVGLLVLRHFLERGHKIILLTGGGTGMIGDPGGKSEERNLLDEATIARNTKAVSAQIRKVFGSSDFIEENNVAWLSKLQLLDFLRDIGKHFTVNAMIKKDVVKTRLDAESPISFTEFSYALLQGYDFLHLNDRYGCDVQVGGSDQWSNILSGVEFIRRKTGKVVYALTWPLLINKSSGKKFGKSEQGAVWLDAQKTSPFQFYQFWFNTDDVDVEEYLLKMTLLPKIEINKVMDEQRSNPSGRAAQKKLAWEVTALVHGNKIADEVKAESEELFSGNSEGSTQIPVQKIGKNSGTYLDILATGLGESKSKLRQLGQQNAIQKVGGEVIQNLLETPAETVTIKVGKNRFLKIEVE